MALDEYEDSYEEEYGVDEEEYETYFPSETPWWMRKALPVLVSSIVHLLLLSVAAYIVFTVQNKQKQPPVVVMKNEYQKPEYNPDLERAIIWTPRIEAEVMVEKPIILLEEEVEITKDVPRGTSFAHLSNKNLESTGVVDAEGIGGGRAGAYGQRWGKGSLAREGGSPGTESAVLAALRWLYFHQDKNGGWDQDGFERHCKDTACGGKGTGQYDVASTGLALLAFLGHGHTHKVGSFKKTVRRGLEWLRKQQNPDGSLRTRSSGVESWVYNHAIGTMALCEAFAVTRDYKLKKPAQKAVDYIRDARNPGLGWRYEPRSGRNDTSVSGWMVLALKAAKTAGLSVDQSVFDGAINWFDRVTNTAGKCGYIRPGDPGSVIRGVNDSYAKLPTMTGVSVICRIFCGQSRRDSKIQKGVDILMANLPDWNKPKNDKVDMYYWYYATYAMFQFGGKKWHTWNKAMKKALLETQRVGGCPDGSWDPFGKWGMVGGRVYATAINALTLEIYYRYLRAHNGDPVASR